MNPLKKATRGPYRLPPPYSLSRRLTATLGAAPSAPNGGEFLTLHRATASKLVVIPDHRTRRRHPHDLVQGRRSRRAARQVGHRALPRAPDVQGHGEEPEPDASPRCVAAHRRPGKRVHRQRLYRLLPARAARAARDDDGVRSRPHDRAGRSPMTSSCRNATSCSRSRTSALPTIRARSSANRSRPRSISIIPMAAGHRLASRDREARSRATRIAFYRRLYAPNNAVLVIAGDVTEREVRDIAEKTYGKIARRPDIGPRLRPQEPSRSLRDR